MPDLGNRGAGALTGAGGALTRLPDSMIGAALRTGISAVTPLVTDAGMASGIPNPVVVDASAAVGVVQPAPPTITGVVG